MKQHLLTVAPLVAKSPGATSSLDHWCQILHLVHQHLIHVFLLCNCRGQKNHLKKIDSQWIDHLKMSTVNQLLYRTTFFSDLLESNWFLAINSQFKFWLYVKYNTKDIWGLVCGKTNWRWQGFREPQDIYIKVFYICIKVGL